MRALNPSKTAFVNVLSRTRLFTAVVNSSNDLRDRRTTPKCESTSARGSITPSGPTFGTRSNQFHSSSTICSAAAQHEMVHVLPHNVRDKYCVSGSVKVLEFQCRASGSLTFPVNSHLCATADETDTDFHTEPQFVCNPVSPA